MQLGPHSVYLSDLGGNSIFHLNNQSPSHQQAARDRGFLEAETIGSLRRWRQSTEAIESQACQRMLCNQATVPSVKGKSDKFFPAPDPIALILPSLTFEVARAPALIRGDGEPQRVTLGIIDTHPSLEYFAMPRRVPKAFLKAECINLSQMALLEGPANVYIDSSFIGKTNLCTAFRGTLV
ncbi:unnamed protein product [Protopolystoma xenopodis]|uniref:Uncharacterized protein n=1 Tax=Protopolystoma xenopodis TaxID=117903 RepID=A0A3S5ADQ1_9PLAT|nr:unnamed protein product [Protopolystoma xenopodis]